MQLLGAHAHNFLLYQAAITRIAAVWARRHFYGFSIDPVSDGAVLCLILKVCQ